jgi:hypothetical protein
MWVPNKKQRKSKESRHVPWFAALWKGRGACWSSKMGLGRIDKLHLLTRAYIKPTQGGYCIVGTLLVLGRAASNSDSQDSPRPGLGGSHHLPPYIIFCASPWGPHPNGILSWDSQVRISKLPKLQLPWLWGPITSCSDLELRWGLKQNCNPRRELSNGMLHAICTLVNWVNSRLLVVRSQTANMTLDLSFGHNLCFRCRNGWCEPILNIYVLIDFQWYKKLFNPLGFNPCNRFLNIWESIGTPTLNVGVALGVWGSIPSHFLALPGACAMTRELPFWPATLQPFANLPQG